jgi:hypothetical protein
MPIKDWIKGKASQAKDLSKSAAGAVGNWGKAQAGNIKFQAQFQGELLKERFSKEEREKRKAARQETRQEKRLFKQQTQEEKELAAQTDAQQAEVEGRQEQEIGFKKKAWNWTKNRWHDRGPSSGQGTLIAGGFLLWIIQITMYRWGTAPISNPTWFIANFIFAIFLLFFSQLRRRSIFIVFALQAFALPILSPYAQTWLASSLKTNVNQIRLLLIYFFTIPAMYPLWMLWGMKNANNRLLKFIYNVYVIGILIILAFTAIAEYGTNLPFAVGGSEWKPKTILGGIQTILHSMKMGFVGIFTGSRGWLVDELNQATGGLYEARVEQAEEEPLGVTIDSIMVTNPAFFTDEEISVWGTLHGRTIEEPINVSLSCWTGENKHRVYGEMIPARMEISIEDIKDFECRFAPKAIEKGMHQVTVAAVYNFQTMSYLKAYFIEETRKRSLVREGIDPFDYLQIQDRQPTAVYTNGPVELSMSLTQALTGIWREAGQLQASPVLSMLIRKGWDGELKNITKMELGVPEGFIADCTGFKKTGSPDAEGNMVYPLNDTISTKLDQGKIFKCRLIVDSADKVLGDLPVKAAYFHLTAGYIYSTAASISVEVFELPEEIALPETGETTT